MPPELKTQDPPPPTWLEDRRTTPTQPTKPAATSATRLPPTSDPSLPTTPRSRAGRGQQRFAQIALAALAGICVGGAMLLAEPFQHRCGATLQMADSSDPMQMGEHRNELMAFVWAQDQDRPTPSRLNWLVEVPSPGTLRIVTNTSDADSGSRQAEALARNFLNHIQSLNESERATPTESEGHLQDHVAVLARRLDDAQSQLDAAMAKLPSNDPRPDKAGLMHRWQSARGDFDTARAQLRQAADEYKRLTQQGNLTHAAVSAQDRQAALLGDYDLQQDLKELGATLIELKLHMLTVWQDSSSSLEQLVSSAASGTTQVTNIEVSDVSMSVREAYSAIAAEMSGYRDAAETFSKAWKAEFAALQHSELDSEGALLLDAYQRIKTLLSEFLFHAGIRLSTIRESVNQISRDPANDAQHHLRQSDAARAFAELQSAHHRFEFGAGALDTPVNFRLDSALRIARGLRRRVADRTREIDERLQKSATARAQAEQNATLLALDEILRKSREASDATVEELVALQDGLQSASASTEQFVAAVAAAELANNRLQLTRTDLDQAESRLRELAAARAAAWRASELKIVSAGILQKNINLEPRLRTAAVGASVTLLAVLLGQILLARSLWPTR